MPFVLKDAITGLEAFDIEFVKLNEGEHVFNFRLDKKFFEAFDNEEILAADIKVEALLERFPTLMNLQLQLSGTMAVSCDRCLVALDMPTTTEHTVIYKFVPEGANPVHSSGESEFVVLTHQDHTINLAQDCYETALLSLPMIRNCDDLETKPCNQEMLAKLNDLSHEEEESSDPRWDKLKQLLKNK